MKCQPEHIQEPVQSYYAAPSFTRDKLAFATSACATVSPSRRKVKFQMFWAFCPARVVWIRPVRLPLFTRHFLFFLFICDAKCASFTHTEECVYIVGDYPRFLPRKCLSKFVAAKPICAVYSRLSILRRASMRASAIQTYSSALALTNGTNSVVTFIYC